MGKLKAGVGSAVITPPATMSAPEDTTGGRQILWPLGIFPLTLENTKTIHKSSEYPKKIKFWSTECRILWS